MIYRLTPSKLDTYTWKTFILKKGLGNAVFIDTTAAKIAEAQADPEVDVKRYVDTVPTKFTVKAY